MTCTEIKRTCSCLHIYLVIHKPNPLLHIYAKQIVLLNLSISNIYQKRAFKNSFVLYPLYYIKDHLHYQHKVYKLVDNSLIYFMLNNEVNLNKQDIKCMTSRTRRKGYQSKLVNRMTLASLLRACIKCHAQGIYL